MKSSDLVIIGSLFMAIAVAFGAFGAHVVQDLLTPDHFDVYKTAVEYQFYHSIGLLILGVLTMQHGSNTWFKWSAYSLITGILIFSGSLYILTLTDTAWLGAVTPLGGFAFIMGWSFLILGVLNQPRE